MKYSNNAVLGKIVLLCLMTLALGSEAYAEMRVVESSPKAGEILAQSPPDISITFSEVLIPEESFIKLLDGAGNPVSEDKVTASMDKTTLHTKIPLLQPGTYIVLWRAVCTCQNHRATQGKYRFSVQ